MRAVAFAVVLIMVIPALSCLSQSEVGAIVPSRYNVDFSDYLPSSLEPITDNIDIVFEKPVYSGHDLSGNLSINATLVNKLDSNVNLTIKVLVEAPYGTQTIGLNYGYGNFFERRALSPLESLKDHYNLTLTNKTELSFFARCHIIGQDPTTGEYICMNSTDIIGLGPVSIKVSKPVPSGGYYAVGIGTRCSITLDVTNYSNETLEGTIADGREFSELVVLAPKSTKSIATIFQSPNQEGSFSPSYYFISDSTSSYIGFALIEGIATNVTAPYLNIEVVKLLRVNVNNLDIELDAPGSLNISIVSMADKVLRNQRFDVLIDGWMNKSISHAGFFMVNELVPGKEVKIPYNIFSRIAGYFRLRIQTEIQGQSYRFNFGLSISTELDINYNVYYGKDREQYSLRDLGDRLSMEGTVQNLYPYPLHDVVVTVIMIEDIGGFLSRDDFLTVKPGELRIENLASGQKVPFVFNVTCDSPGDYNLKVGAFWGGNATPGGVLDGRTVTVSRPSAVPVLTYIIPIACVVIALPKALDLIIRYRRKIAF
jgi:hypothetical protein